MICWNESILRREQPEVILFIGGPADGDLRAFRVIKPEITIYSSPPLEICPPEALEPGSVYSMDLRDAAPRDFPIPPPPTLHLYRSMTWGCGGKTRMLYALQGMSASDVFDALLSAYAKSKQKAPDVANQY